MSRRLLTLDECAELTGTKVRWWRTAVFQKRLPVVHLGRLVRIDEADLEAYLAANRQPAREGGDGYSRTAPLHRLARNN